MSIDSTGQTALHYGSKNGHRDIVKYLISYAPNSIINMVDNAKWDIWIYINIMIYRWCIFVVKGVKPLCISRLATNIGAFVTCWWLLVPICRSKMLTAIHRWFMRFTRMTMIWPHTSKVSYRTTEHIFIQNVIYTFFVSRSRKIFAHGSRSSTLINYLWKKNLKTIFI